MNEGHVKVAFLIFLGTMMVTHLITDAGVRTREAAAVETCVRANPGNAAACHGLFKAVTP